MIRCAVCKGRVRPPKRPWTDSAQGVHFYRTTSSVSAYAKWLAAFSKRVPFVHERCAETAEPDTLPTPHVIALDLQRRLR